MEPSKLTKQILEFYDETQRKEKIDTIKWTAAVKEHLKASCLTQTGIILWYTHIYSKVFDWKDYPREVSRRNGLDWWKKKSSSQKSRHTKKPIISVENIDCTSHGLTGPNVNNKVQYT